MTWQIVVGVLIVVAIAVHFGEKAKERARRAKVVARRASTSPSEVSFTREIREVWSADLRAMTLQVARTELQVARTEMGAAASPVDRFDLRREASGAWTIIGSASPPALPPRFAEQLEARFRGSTTKAP